MTQPAAPASPCIEVCVLDAARTCVGCGRTVEEIARWGRMGTAEKWQVVARAEGRLRQAQGALVEFQQAARAAEG